MLSNEVDPTGNMDAHGDDYLNRQVDDIFRDACNQLFAGVCDGIVTAHRHFGPAIVYHAVWGVLADCSEVMKGLH